MEELDLDLCYDCEDRIFVKALADLELKRYENVINLLKPYSQGIDKIFFKIPLIKAYTRNENKEMADGMLHKLKIMAEAETWKNVYNKIGADLLLIDRNEEAVNYFKKVINSSTTMGSYNQALAHFYLNNYEESKTILENINQDEPSNFGVISMLAICYHKTGQKLKAEQLIDSLDSLKKDYQYGAIDYAKAQFYAQIGDKQNTFKYLLQAVAAGKKYTSYTFQNDPQLKPIFETEMFNQILKFWHN